MEPPSGIPRVQRLHPLTAFVRRLDGEYYTCTEVAVGLNIDPSYLSELPRRFPDLPEVAALAPSVSVRYRGKVLRLYTGEDLNRIARYYRKYPSTGRRRLRTEAEAADRLRITKRIRDYRLRAEQSDDEAKRAHCLAQAAKLRAELDAS